MAEALKFIVLAIALTKATYSRQWCLAIITFLLPLSIWLPQASMMGVNATNLLLLPVLFHALVAGPRRGSSGRRDPLLIPMTILLLFAFISLVRVQMFEELPWQFVQGGGHRSNLTTVKAMVVGFVLYFCSRRLTRDPHALRLAIAGAMCGYLLQAGMAATDFVRGVEFHERAEGALGESNELGLFLAAYTMMPVAFLFDRTRRLFLIAIATVAVSLMGILGTLSRGALLVAGAAVTSMALVRRNLSVLAVLAAVALSPFWLPQNVLDRFGEAKTRDRSGLSSVPGFVSSEKLDLNRETRVHLWRAGMRMVADRPLLGVGFGLFQYVVQDYDPRLRRGSGPHNLYLWLGAQAGAPALFAHVAIMLGLGWSALTLARRRDGSFESTFGLGVAGMTAAFMVGGMFLSGFYANTLSGPFFVLAGIAVNLEHAAQTHQEKGRTTSNP